MGTSICVSKKTVLIAGILLLIFIYPIGSSLITSNSRTLSSKASPSMINYGQLAIDNEFPFFATLHKKIAPWIPFCGSSLISDTYLVTAAHCVYNLQPEELRVLIGINHFDKEKKLLSYNSVKNIIVHPDFVYDTPLYKSDSNPDIAILELTNSVPDIPTISLPSPNIDRTIDGKLNVYDFPERTLRESSRGTFMGYGYTQNNTRSKDLLKAVVELKPATFGAHSFSLWFSEKRANVNDSGGPFTMFDGKKTLLVGITKSQIEATNTSTFTSVTAYAQWIHDKTGINYEKGSYVEAFQATIPYPVQISKVNEDDCRSVTTIDTCNGLDHFCRWTFDGCGCHTFGLTQVEACT